MSGPTQELINRCYSALAQCGYFDSLNHMRAIFVSDELRPFRDRIRDAPSIDERIKLNVDYLLYQSTSDGRHVFTSFLTALRPSSKHDALYEELEALREEFEHALGQVSRVQIPHVVAAMTQGEAESLATGTVFEDPRVAPIERVRFEKLIPLLPEHWIENYGPTRDECKLHSDRYSVMSKVISVVSLIFYDELANGN